jgi:hypothetical protein
VGMDDVFSTESALVAAVTATVLSPKTRETMRKGAVYGLAGVMKAGDVVAGAARGAVRGVRGEASETAGAAPVSSTATPTPTARRSRATGGTGTRRAAGSSAATRQAAATARSGGNATSA